jgi:DNA repair protein RadD
MIQLRDYQQDAKLDIYKEWALTCENVLAVMPTGSGKTVLFSAIVSENEGGSCVIAHRQELVGQISMALARNGVQHRIIAPTAVIKEIVKSHMVEIGKTFYNPQARVGVAGVGTLINRKIQLHKWLMTVSLWVQDEAHHVLDANQWGEAAAMFPNARGLGVTATPERADGQGLGRHADGLFDSMVVGPTMRDLINRGFLTDYRIVCPSSDLDLSQIKTSAATGDYNLNQMRDAVANSSLVVSDGKSRVIGDVVANYLKFAPGCLGVAFAPDVSIATRIAEQFKAMGVIADVVSAKTPSAERAKIIERFRKREIMVLVNVDLFGEGFDLPAIEVVMMMRPTQSYSLYTQQFGRALRIMPGKERALIIDHVGNVMRHKLPDVPRQWTLDRRDKRGKSEDDATPLRVCSNNECLLAYERFLTVCPACGTEVPPPSDTDRTGPEFVDGDLFELDDETLARMRGDVIPVDDDMDNHLKAYQTQLEIKNAPYIGKHMRDFRNKLHAKREATIALRDIMAWWAGHHRAEGRTDSQIFRIFYLRFNVDWLSAMALDCDAALALGERVAFNMGKV